MNKRDKDIILYGIAIFFFLIFSLAATNFLRENNYYALFWVCYIAIPIIIFGLVKKNSGIILSQIIILAIPDLFWMFDFFDWIFFGHTVFGTINYFPGEPLLLKIASLQHLFILPLSLFALSLLKLKKNYKILLISLGEITLTFFLTLFLIPLKSINCIKLDCITIPLNFLPFYLIWFMFAFSFITISYIIITSLPFVKKK